jgi:hypothetical protein
LLADVASEKPHLLLRNEQFDHYLLLNTDRVSKAKNFAAENFIVLFFRAVSESPKRY